jgi:serine O-acetyltransferase
MLSNSKIIGDSNIGDNVIIAANTYIKDTNIPNNSIVFGSSPNLVLKENKLNLF